MKCINCGQEKDRLGQHWAMSCEYPRIDSYKRSLLTGILMGDGHIPAYKSGNSQMRIRMTNKEFLDWLNSELSYMSNGVRFIQSAEESAKYMRESNFRPNAKKENYSDVWEINTRTHPYFTSLRKNWYTPEKDFPLDLIPFNSVAISMWYVTDGYLCNRENHNPYSAFRLDSQSHKSDEISEKFDDIGFKNTVRDGGNVIAISPNVTPEFLQWLGKAPDGFEYKWGI